MLKLPRLVALDGFLDCMTISVEIHGNVCGLERIEGVGSKIAADNSSSLLVGGKLSSLRASPAGCTDGWIGMRLPFQGVRINNDEIRPAPETYVNI